MVDPGHPTCAARLSILLYKPPVQQAASGIGHRVIFFFFIFGVETNALNLRNNVTFRFLFKQQQRIIG